MGTIMQAVNGGGLEAGCLSSSMIMLSWNARGPGRPEKRSTITRRHKVDILILKNIRSSVARIVRDAWASEVVVGIGCRRMAPPKGSFQSGMTRCFQANELLN